MTDVPTAKITIRLNPPKGLKEGTVMIGIGDEKICEGTVNETVTLELPYGYRELLVLVRNRGIDSWSSVTPVEIRGDMSLKIKYSLFSRSAKLVFDD